MYGIRSERFLDLDVGAAAFPYAFQALAAAKYPSDRRYQAQAVSLSLESAGGDGTITITGTDGTSSVWPVSEGRLEPIGAVAITAASGVTRVKVYL